MTLPRTPLTHNFLFAIPPRNTFQGEYLCAGDGRQLDTQVVHIKPGPYPILVLPEITPQPKVFLEYTLHVGADHPLSQWPDSFNAFRPLQGTHRKSFASWLRSRTISSDDTDEFFVWQQVVAPCETMPYLLSHIGNMFAEANAAGKYFSAAPGAIQQMLENLGKQ